MTEKGLHYLKDYHALHDCKHIPLKCRRTPSSSNPRECRQLRTGMPCLKMKRLVIVQYFWLPCGRVGPAVWPRTLVGVQSSDTSAPRQSNSALSNGGQCQPIDILQSAVSHCQLRRLSFYLQCMMQVRHEVALDQSGNNPHVLLPLTAQLCSSKWKVFWSRKLVWLFCGVDFVTTVQLFL